MLESYNIFPSNVIYCSLNDKEVYLRIKKQSDEHIKKSSNSIKKIIYIKRCGCQGRERRREWRRIKER